MRLPGVTVATHDLLDASGLAELMQGCDVVFHLAATVHAPPNAPLSAFQEVNVDGTRAVVGAAVASRVSAFVLFSTVAVYPESDDWLDESSPVGPSTPYGSTKLVAERLALEKRDQMRVTILRLPVVYGPRDRGNVRRLIDAIARHRFVIPGSGANVKTMVAAENVAQAAVHVACDARAADKIYLVTDDQPATLLDIVAAITDALQFGRMPLKVPKFVLAGAAWLADAVQRFPGLRLPISGNQIRTITSNTRFSGERLRLELGFQPRVALREGIAKAVDAYLAERRRHASVPELANGA